MYTYSKILLQENLSLLKNQVTHQLQRENSTILWEMQCLEFIKKSVAESEAERVVVVTHHLPSYAVVAPLYKDSPLNSAFATELGDFIADSRIDTWIFGHSHANAETIVGNTRLVCNQLGYVYYREHLNGFDGGKFVEV